ncbi:hypothetical protein APZ24_gp131 [Ostreococcus lucimarinus virus 2]|uniref:hypothetical protein n=1 Tax=Ostreococcus lucimarinus virus 2 TaxID=1663208 RepID=UPI0006D0FA46|nr:hypothetical protein APZ24_gp131 [Ostreococcus lucimarinus virus 2]ALI95494.1 hypothetical protein OlV2_131c [Ostreococcus lucimarinus virus 2]
MYTSQVLSIEKNSFLEKILQLEQILKKMKTPGQSPERITIIFLGISMDHHPTSFLILDNKELGTFWVGQANIKPGANDRAVNVYQLIDKLSSKYEEEYPHLCFDVESIACEIFKFHELEKWITDLLYQIKRKPLKLMELNELLTAGWGEGDYTTNSTIHVLRVNKTREGLRNTYKKLIGDWEAKGFRCLNKLRCKTYEDKKQDPNFMYNRARKEVLRQIKKTGKMPKQSTVEKYELKNSEIKEVMEEVVFCQPCEKEFYKKNGRWYCFCDKRIDRCFNPKCKNEGIKLGLKVGGKRCKHNKEPSKCKVCGGGSYCEHNRERSKCKECGGSQICEHNRVRSKCKECGGGHICKHNKYRSQCKDCGGSQICKHNIIRSTCKICNGGSVCKHNIQSSTCKICRPQRHIANLRRNRRWNAINSTNSTHTLDDLCMTSKEWLKYLHKTFEDRYGRPKTEKDEVHIDEIIPCSAWNLPDDNKYCWHYLNSQWLLAEDNLSKSDSYEEEDKLAMIERIQSSTYISSSEIG